MTVLLLECSGESIGGALSTAGGNTTPNNSYKSITIGGTTWMKKNLNIKTADSWCYGNSTANCDKYGRLYTWAAAKSACPSGWHLPSSQEWGNLVVTTGGKEAGKRLKARNGWKNNGNGTDDLGFSALPGGYRYFDGRFGNVGGFGYWWTATENSNDYAVNRIMGYNQDNVDANAYGRKDNGYAVRCVQD
jgi:uncharacterized protein (TIGR02145 family)